MFTVTRFCLQAFAKRPGGLVPTEARECRFEEEARRELAPLARRSAGVALYRVRGEPVSNLWCAPKLIERHGEILDLD